MLRTNLLAAVFAVAGTAALAGSPVPAPAPIPAPAPPPAHDWSGFYAGATIGYGSADSTHCDAAGCNSLGSSPLPSPEPDGAVGGLTIGFNFQPSRNFVWGIEADYSFANMSETVPSTIVFGCGGGCQTQINGFGTIRARIGMPMGSRGAVLPYLTGGVAFTDIEGDILGFGLGSRSSVETSAVAGLGVEYAPARNWSVKLEYLHIFETDSFVYDPTLCLAPGCGVKDVKVDVIRLGLNYNF